MAQAEARRCWRVECWVLNVHYDRMFLRCWRLTMQGPCGTRFGGYLTMLHFNNYALETIGCNNYWHHSNQVHWLMVEAGIPWVGIPFSPCSDTDLCLDYTLVFIHNITIFISFHFFQCFFQCLPFFQVASRNAHDYYVVFSTCTNDQKIYTGMMPRAPEEIWHTFQSDRWSGTGSKK